jgi:replication initiation protein RepC
MERTNTGWRRLTPAQLEHVEALHDADKKALFDAGHLAVKALSLRPGARFILEQLVGVYGGMPIEGRLLVWPSNELLQDRTGLSERAIRYGLRTLIELGVITAKDSANGKRYARRSASGQITSAFGLDLTPLLTRVDEFRAMVDAMKERRRERIRLLDEITICRRATQEALQALSEWFPAVNIDALEKRFTELVGALPRRDSQTPVDPALTAWRALRSDAEALYMSACGGKNSRHKEHNNESPDQSCNNGQENVKAKPAAKIEFSLGDLLEACPDAARYWTPVRSIHDLVTAASTLRGMLGAHLSAWEEACVAIGPAAAAAAVFIVLQIVEKDREGRIRNKGGYLRAYIRKVEAGEIDLSYEVQAMRRRRKH